MPALNRVQLIGRLGKDPDTRSTTSGRNVVHFSLAVDRRWKGADGTVMKATDWFTIEAWGSLGEVCQKYLGKGRLVYVDGRLKTDRFEDKGEMRYFTKVIASQVEILEWPSEKDEPAVDAGGTPLEEE
jgi:single-strand DNA-binding protein